MTNAFDEVNSTPTLPPIDIKAISKTQLAQEFADALRRTYTEADLRKQALDLVNAAIGIAKPLI